jgi:DNA adenine methylase
MDNLSTFHDNKKYFSTFPWAPPFLRWAGSKKKLLPTLMANIPSNYKRYIEPFCGSACLFFAIKPQSAILSDINSDLIQCYNMILKHPRLLWRFIKKIPNTDDAYLEYRKMEPANLDPLVRAARFLYLNRYCFNGVYRTNTKGQFNVPRGTRTGSLPEESAFYRCAYALRKARLLPVDFETSLKLIRKGDFIYLDPPYATTEKPLVKEYGPNSFQRKDINRLICALAKIDQKDATFILSYAQSKELTDQIDPAWNVSKILVRRHVAGFAKHRACVTEMLISNKPIIQDCHV